MKFNKKTEVKFETAQEFLKENRNTVYSILFSEFRFLKIEKSELSKKYFNYILNSKYNELFTVIIRKKDLEKSIRYSVENFKKTIEESLSPDIQASNDFEDERRKDRFMSKSI